MPVNHLAYHTTTIPHYHYLYHTTVLPLYYAGMKLYQRASELFQIEYFISFNELISYVILRDHF